MRNLIILILLSGLVVGCSSSDKGKTGSEAGAVVVPVSGNENTVLELDPTSDSLLRIETSPVQRAVVNESVHCTGFIEVPPQSLASISSTMGGFVTQIKPYAGSWVKKGEIIAELEHPDYVALQQSYLQAKADRDYLRKELARQQILRSENANATKVLEQTETESRKMDAEVAGLESRLRMAGISPDKVSPENITSKVLIRAPFAGYVSNVLVNYGKYVAPQEVICEMMNREHLHLELSVFEQDMLKLKKGQEIWFRVANSGNAAQYQAHVEVVAQNLDREKRTLNVHGHMEGRNTEELKPGSMVEAEILTGADSVWAVPETAVFTEGGQQWVILKVGPHSYRKQAIVSSGASNGKVAINANQTGATEWEVVVLGVRALRASMNKE